MNKKLSSTVVLLVVLLALPSPALPQASEELAGQAAARAGRLREALTHYMAAWKAALADVDRGQPNWVQVGRIRQAMFTVVPSLDPAPAVPDEVLVLEGRAEAAVKSAQGTRDYNDAADAYWRAIRLAPWVPRLYFNHAIVLEKAGNIEGAVAELIVYLQAAPGADDAADVRKKIGGLQYQLDKDAREKAAAQAAQVQRQEAAEQAKLAADQAIDRIINNLSGNWVTPGGGNRYQYAVVTLPGYLTVSWTYVDWGEGWREARSKTVFQGKFQGFNVVGEYRIENAKNISSRGDGQFSTGPFTGQVSRDGRTITIDYQYRGSPSRLTLQR